MATTQPVVLIIEDEPTMRRFLRTALAANGYAVVEAATAREGLAQAAGRNPELILLDLGLPDGDGLEVAKRIRERQKTPIVVLSARGREQDKVAALDLGADDYLTKPFGVAELLARLRVALRHANASQEAGDEPVLSAGPLLVDRVRRQVFVQEREIHLTPTEYKLLLALLGHPGRVRTHQQLLSEVWGPGYVGQVHYLRVYMAQLRHKLETDPNRPRLLLTEPGVGYRLREQGGGPDNA